MNAAFVSVGLFLTYGTIGYGPLALLAGERPLVVRALLAPAMGIALTTIPAFVINRLGYPVQLFASYEVTTLILLSISTTLWAYKRYSAPYSRHGFVTSGSLFLLLLIAMVFVGWPGLHSGLDWLGYANDDMANYALSATRLKYFGYDGPPVINAVSDGSDMSQLYWHLTFDTRYGGDLALAVIASVLRIGVAPVFMPTMLALHGALISAAASLVVAERPRRAVAVTAVFFCILNPLIAFSTYSELLAQVGGIAQAAGLLAVVVNPWRLNGRATAGRAAIVGLMLFGVFIWYYEVLILVLPAMALYFLLHAPEVLNSWKRLLVAAIVVVASIAILSGSYLQTSIRAIAYQLAKGSTAYPADAVVFPYFLIKEGLSSFWGLSPIIGEYPVPTWKLALGIVLFGLVVAALFDGFRRRHLSACIVGVLSAVSLTLFWKQADFGVFKAALYLQPFLSVLLAGAAATIFVSSKIVQLSIARPWLKSFTNRPSRVFGMTILLMLVCVVAVFTIGNQYKTLVAYGRIASDQQGSAYFNQLPGGSRLGLLSVLIQMPRPIDGGHYILDSDNSVLTKLITLYTLGTPTDFLSYYPFKTSDFISAFNKHFPELANNNFAGRAIDIPFKWMTTGAKDVLRLRPEPAAHNRENDVLIAAAADNSVLNRLQLGYPNGSPVVVQPFKGVTNHLAYLPTLEKARHYFDYDFPDEKFGEYRSNIALWPNEPDYFYKSRTLVGAGRYVLLRVINPQTSIRLMLELTASLQSDGQNNLPPVKLFEGANSSIKTVGRGSARVFSTPIKPVLLGSAEVVGIDVGVDAHRFTDSRGNFTGDTRRLTTFFRDISLITTAEYDRNNPPSRVRNFPEDLANKNLEYSGIYEDGWIAESATVRLASRGLRGQFVVAGQTPWDPEISGVSEILILIDGIEKARYPLTRGSFSIPLFLEPTEKPISVEIQVNGALPLGSEDRRPASVKLTYLGWLE